MPSTKHIPTDIISLLGCRYPIIAGPMFLISNEDLVVAVSEAGGIGATPSLNWRKSSEFHEAIVRIKARTSKPFAVNLIVNKANTRQYQDLEVCIKERVPLIITSLGNPKEVIRRMHDIGGKVFCDVTDLEYAKKVEDLGADGVIAVGAGAGGHAGNISPLVLIPYLKKYLKVPVIAAGGIATGQQLAAVMLLGASGALLGTRFIASTEAQVSEAYKKAILEAGPEDIVLSKKISGTPAAVINTPAVKKMGLDLNPIESMLFRYPKTRKYVKMIRTYIGASLLKESAQRSKNSPNLKEVWGAGQSVAFINEILPAQLIIEKLMKECSDSLS
ncbi:MAG: nitronate monooxygenase [Bdellovibrionota bacterium]